jgi:hypothetical protein
VRQTNRLLKKLKLAGGESLEVKVLDHVIVTEKLFQFCRFVYFKKKKK